MWTISSEGVTPPSSLLRAHVPLPLGSPLLQHLASFEESLQVVRSPCCPRELPDAISESLSLDAGSPTPAVHRVLSPCMGISMSRTKRAANTSFFFCPSGVMGKLWAEGPHGSRGAPTEQGIRHEAEPASIGGDR